jgi:hypothetical protein
MLFVATRQRHHRHDNNSSCECPAHAHVLSASTCYMLQLKTQVSLWRQGLHKAVANSSSRVVRFTSFVNICVNCCYRLCFAPNTVLRLIIVFNLYKKAVLSLPFRSSRPSPRTCSFCPSPLRGETSVNASSTVCAICV